ncbi:MAG: septum formation initiator family protein, partial [Pseudomonadota bacterium]|nr:septum formation initiator family protein [Pseudomonadota bacterium]
MDAIHQIKGRARKMLVPIMGALFFTYFVVHSFYGDRGIIAWLHLQKQVSLAEQTLSALHDSLDDYDRRINLLRANQLDGDMLDERSRVMAG